MNNKKVIVSIPVIVVRVDGVKDRLALHRGQPRDRSDVTNRKCFVFFYHKEASSTSEGLCQYSCDSNESILYTFTFLHQNALPNSSRFVHQHDQRGLKGVSNILF